MVLADATPDVFELKPGFLVDRQSGQVIAASLMALVKHVVFDLNASEDYLIMLLLVHKKVVKSSCILLKLFINLFDKDHGFLDVAVKGHILNIILYWISNYPIHFSKKKVQIVLAEFLNELQDRDILFLNTDHFLSAIQPLLEKPFVFPVLSILDMYQIDDDNFPEMNIGTDFDVQIFAEQLTLIQDEMFSRIELNNIFSTYKGMEYLSKEYNKIAKWVVLVCLNNREDESLKGIIKFFVSLSGILRSLQNYAGMFSIYCGLTVHEVEKLPNVWDSLGELNNRVWKKTARLCNPKGGYKYIKELQEDVEPPLIPQIGRAFLKKFYF
eukprot:TRINITY_DN2171_c0_g1_i2.p1 TRINITY_DN2171_c0_g1~~TRINITY_DN2171_c0_g1_i2.p1  ORF type:complete len:326 (-),score=64.10 TRINITY_DN2171_c0_g1_i2:179-1156(-)